MAERGPKRLASRPVLSRSVWALVAQGLSSSSNFVLSALVLSTATRAQFATFSICLMSYLLAAQLSRSLLSLPVLILYSDSDPAAGHATAAAARSVAGLAVVMGAVVAVPLGLAAVASPAGRGQFVALAALLPLLLYQDIVRHVAFARANPKAAALADGLWLVLQLAASALAIASGRRSPAVLLGLWAAAGAVSAGVFGVVLGALPRLGGLVAWVRAHRRLCTGLAVEFACISGSTYLLYYGLSVVAGADELGRIRAAQTFIGPVTVALLGGAALGVPESVRLRDDPRRMRRFATVLAAGLAAGTAVFGVLAWSVLPWIGPRLFPHTWSGARPVVPVLTLFATGLAVSTGAACALRATGEVSWIARTRAMTGGATLVVGLPASYWLGANGALGALAASETLFAALAWRRLRHLDTSRCTPEARIEGPAGDAERWGPAL